MSYKALRFHTFFACKCVAVLTKEHISDGETKLLLMHKNVSRNLRRNAMLINSLKAICTSCLTISNSGAFCIYGFLYDSQCKQGLSP
jgi:hypothetical protein